MFGLQITAGSPLDKASSSATEGVRLPLNTRPALRLRNSLRDIVPVAPRSKDLLNGLLLNTCKKLLSAALSACAVEELVLCR